VLHLHRAERADGLIEALADLLATPLEDPFAPELIAVPTRGMERWLTQRLSDRLGICANVDFPSPRRLVDDAVADASGIEPDQDAWRPERLVWPLLEVVDGSLHEPWLRSLASHLGATADTADHARQSRRFASVRHIAELYDRYALQRPSMVRAWAKGRDVGATGEKLPPDTRWQANLWRRLRERVGQPDPAERIDAASARLQHEPGIVELPGRLAVFGLTRLPAGRLQVLEALAAHREIHLFLLHPSPALWEKVAGAPRQRRRAGDATRALPDNRLLASWGQDVRELQLVVGPAAQADHHHPAPQREDTMLARLQAAVRSDAPAEPGPADRSIEIHACHGRARQVEVLRDAILHLLAEDTTLEPRDVIVLCPDIETFAPLIQATFGAGEVSPEDDELDDLPEEDRPPDLRVRLADRSLRQTNPLLGFVSRLLELGDQRLTAAQVLDLADRDPVRRRFGLDDDDLARTQEWVAQSGIRWGLDAEHRKPFKLDQLDAGTWRFGLDRLLLGVAMTEDEQRLFSGVLPLDDVESGAIELAGRLAELVDRLREAVDAMAAPMTVEAWAQALARAADSLTATSPFDAWQRAELQRLLDDIVAEAGVSGAAGTELALAEVRALLADRLEGRPTRTNFRTGHLTICTLVPMRSVPHRIVCLLGLDDGEFPRKAVRDGDDLVLRDPHVGDRDSRMEDRQMLLDALMAATDKLIVTYTGKDERTNTPRPPAVPVGELLDAIEEQTGRPRREVVVQHPLQPFDPRNFTEGALVPGRTWGFDRVTLQGAKAIDAPRTPPEPFLEQPLPAAGSELVELDSLVRFAERPVSAFLRQRLGISTWEDDDEVEEALSVELDPLELYAVGSRLLEARLGGADLEACLAAERARGLLPPGKLGDAVLDRLGPQVEAIAGRALAEADGGAGAVDVRVTIGGTRLGGTVGEVHGTKLRVARYSRVNARQRIATWVRWLALTAAHPDRGFEAVLIGRAPSGADEIVRTVRYPAIEAGEARERLAALLDLYARGLREPLPLATGPAASYVTDGELAARREWDSRFRFDGEDRRPEHRLAFGGVRSFDELLAEPPGPDERWFEGEPTRFGQLARRLWCSVSECEGTP
jgi:exodeoxyribonuclease V gamma subunit